MDTHPSVNVWPNMDGPLGCVRIFTAPKSIIVGRVVKDAYKKPRVRDHMIDYTPAVPPSPRQADPIVYDRDIHIWTDGSAKDNGTDVCTAGSAWVSDLHFGDKVSLTGATLSNNVAEVAAIVLCLSAWRDAHIVVHTDSTFVLGLLRGGLLAMERDGWGDAPHHLARGPPTPLLQMLLYLLRDRTGRLHFEKAKAHGDDVMNNRADSLANEGRLKGRTLNLGSLVIPAGWIDTAPVLCHQPLDYLTKLVVHVRVGAPATTTRFESFSNRWVVSLGFMFGVVLDPGNYIKKVWDLTIPEGLKEVLWKEMNGAQVIGHRYYGRGHAKSDLGRWCLCGSELTLGHLLLGCSSYNLQPLMTIMLTVLGSLGPTTGSKTLSPDEWGTSPWYPLLALRELEEMAYPIVKGRKKILKSLKKTRHKREWVVSNYFWALWKWRMKEIHDESFKFTPMNCASSLSKTLTNPVPLHLLPRAAAEEDDTGPPCREPDPKAPARGPTMLPPPVPSYVGACTKAQLTDKGKSILHAILAPESRERPRCPSRREAILWALTDDAYA